MRGVDTPIRKLRHQVFTAIAWLAWSDAPLADFEKIPYEIIPGDVPVNHSNIWQERAIVSEQLRLAMGLSLRPDDRPTHITDGLAESNIDEKYYEPPLMQVIPSACAACPDRTYVVSDQCRGCIAHPCTAVCPRGAIEKVNGKSVIDQSKCIKCGRCKDICPYDAIAHHERPCAKACGVKAIQSDSMGRARINEDKCVSCGMCMVSCPFGAIADKSQIFQLIRAMQHGKEVYAEVAPAFAGQFGDKVSPAQIKAALKLLGFKDVYEVAIGADEGCVAEAHHYANTVALGKLPFLLTSCCPSWSVLAKKQFPDIIGSISNELTPMVATARRIKAEHPDCSIVFIGPCASKKLEASRRTVRSDVDFVITFEELYGMFEAKHIELEKVDASGEQFNDASSAGRGYGYAGGVAEAIQANVQKYYPMVNVRVERAQGLAECAKILAMAKAGRMNGCLIEGMACPGGCVGGAGTLLPTAKATAQVKKFAAQAERPLPEDKPE